MLLGRQDEDAVREITNALGAVPAFGREGIITERNSARIVRSFAIFTIGGLAIEHAAIAADSKPLPHPVGVVRQAQALLQAQSRNSGAAPFWTPLVNQPSFLADGASNPILLTDGTVIIQDARFPDWWKLTADQSAVT